MFDQESSFGTSGNAKTLTSPPRFKASGQLDMDIPSVVPYVLANRQRFASLRVVGTTCPDHLALSGPACTGSVVVIQHTNDDDGDGIDVDEQ